MSNPLIDSLLPNVDSILGVRDSIGAVLHTVSLLTRTWQGAQPGNGNALDQIIQIKPTPQIVEYSHDIRLIAGGAIKQGDIIIKGISKHNFEESFIDGTSIQKNIEKFYLIDDRIYTVINVKERYLSWDVQVRKLSNQTRYREVE